MSDLESIQCPHCEMYRVEAGKNGCNPTTDIMLFIFTGGLWSIVIIARVVMETIQSNRPIKSGAPLQCQVCGYTWLYEE